MEWVTNLLHSKNVYENTKSYQFLIKKGVLVAVVSNPYSRAFNQPLVSCIHLFVSVLLSATIQNHLDHIFFIIN